MKLSNRTAATLTRPGTHASGTPTLYLRVAPGGSKQWVQRLTINGKRRDLGLGGFPLVSVEAATIRATENRLTVWKGGDPLADRRKQAMPTFGEAMLRTQAALRSGWKTETTAEQWLATLQNHAKRLHDLPVDRIERADVLAVLTPIWQTKPKAARSTRSNMKATLQWCVAQGFITENLAGEAIDGALARGSASKGHHAAIAWRDTPETLHRLGTLSCSLTVRYALRFIVLTAARTAEVRLATWAEIDRKARIWTIPAARMKAGKEHRVPLSDAALAVLNAAAELSDGSGLIFPSPRKQGAPIGRRTMLMAFREIDATATIHGFRSSFRDWCAEHGVDRATAEAALAHTVGNAVERAYFRSDLFDKRRVLMNQWAEFLTGTAAKVVRIRA